MLGSATLALSTVKSRQAAAADPRGGTAHPSGLTSFDGGRRPRRTRGRSSGGARAPFMERMESRWRKRRDNGGY